MIEISQDPLEAHTLEKTPIPTSAGGIVIFEGRVRDQHDGKKVVALEYEAYEQLAVSEWEAIIREAMELFSIADAQVVHRVGHLKVGELALWMRVAAPHRDAAFRACRYIVDQLKARLPIWKKEYYLDGDPSWVGCKNCSPQAQEQGYYHHQLQLKEIGIEGQKKLKQSRVLVVGAGGLGCPALTYLTAAGIGNIGICDGDRVEVSNLHRQMLFSYNDIGGQKVELAKRRLLELNPFVNIQTFDHHVNLSNIAEVLSDYDLVLDCTDDMQTRFLLHDVCYFQKIPFIQAAVYQFEGKLQVFLPGSDNGCLRCLFPSPPKPGCYQNCDEAGVIGYVPGIIGSFQAAEAVKILLSMLDLVQDQLLLINLNSYSFTRLERLRNPGCPLCGDSPTITEITPGNYPDASRETWEITLCDNPEQLWRDYHFVDIRDAEERNLSNFREKSMKHIPVSERSRFHSLPNNKQYLLVCQTGLRSYKLVKELRTSGYNNFFSLVGGVSTI